VSQNRTKRAFDFTLAIILVLPSIPLCLLCMTAIFLETTANPVFRQMRVGQGGKAFWIYKLRTMHINTRQAASHEVSMAQVTKTGRILRKYKIDELPQLINVINDTMSFVGPRPCLPTQLELLAERQARGVGALKPGITGPGQIAGLDMSAPAPLAEADSLYLKPWSIGIDIGYLWKTFAGGGRGDAVGV
jgi:O-antigen biosynthesis protein WbqP